MNINIKYGSRNQNFDFAEGTSIDNVLNDSAIRGALGYGQSVEAHLDGVPQKGSITLRDGDTLSVHDKQCSKAADTIEYVAVSQNGGLAITVSYGSGREYTDTYPEGVTLAQAVLNNPEVRGKLGFGDNVEGHIGGVPQKPETKLADGDRVKVYDRQCSKAGA